MRVRALVGAFVAATLLAGCRDGTGPEDRQYRIAVHDGDDQLGALAQPLPDPLRVAVTIAGSGEPAARVRVTWQVTSGAGARVEPASSLTDSAGIATARWILGPAAGEYTLEATVAGATGAPAAFRARAVVPASITALSPDPVAAGSTLTITGTDFSPIAADNAVLFGGVRGTVLSASSTELRVIVPPCIPGRTVDVHVQLGPVASAPVPLTILGTAPAPLRLGLGEARTLLQPAGFACFVLAADPGMEFLLVPQNAAAAPGRAMPYRLSAFGDGGTVAAASRSRLPALDPTALAGTGAALPAMEWEAHLRTRERMLPPMPPPLPAPGPRILATPPAVGSRRDFKVYNKDGKFTTVTAEVKHVSDHAIIYQDVKAPKNGFSPADFAAFAAVFDDPIHDVTVAAFGQPSDRDQNGRVIILFTPVVNALTPRGSPGVVAGFFYGIDLYSKQDFAGSNEAEIFYAMVPDPAAEHSDRRTVAQVFEQVPPILAHEFQHMIAFNQRRFLAKATSDEELWLAEGLAHMAEELVGEELLRRGNLSDGLDFQRPNRIRASLYLARPDTVGLLAASDDYGNLALRGAAWLLLAYLRAQTGSDAILAALTRSTLAGAANVADRFGKPWNEVFNDWAVALWTDDALPAGAALDPRFTFPGIELRKIFAAGFPLAPAQLPFDDFAAQDTLASGTPDYLLVRAGTGHPPSLFLTLGGTPERAFASDAAPQITVVRVK